MLDTMELIRELVALPAPAGEEQAVREYILEHLSKLAYTATVDGKGNVVVPIGGNSTKPAVLVAAHMDEIALMITQVHNDGTIRVTAHGGTYPWKWGEGPVEILTQNQLVSGVLSFGSIHTSSKNSLVERAATHSIQWDDAYVFTGLSYDELQFIGVRPGLRVVIASSRRCMTELGSFVGSYFLDDRADLAVWLKSLEVLRHEDPERIGNVTFIATTSEEINASGVQNYLSRHQFDICVALEIGPKTPETNFTLDSQPTICVNDSWAAMESVDGYLLAECCVELNQKPHWQYISRGGSDATGAASRGLIGRPVVLGLPVDNSHGYEIMHRDAPFELQRLLLTYLRRLSL